VIKRIYEEGRIPPASPPATGAARGTGNAGGKP
jgi:hypothetical protein